MDLAIQSLCQSAPTITSKPHMLGYAPKNMGIPGHLSMLIVHQKHHRWGRPQVFHLNAGKNRMDHAGMANRGGIYHGKTGCNWRAFLWGPTFSSKSPSFSPVFTKEILQQPTKDGSSLYLVVYISPKDRKVHQDVQFIVESLTFLSLSPYLVSHFLRPRKQKKHCKNMQNK